ncbi:MAG: NYN domain-containing protein [Deltaproteobacteria bacterium]|nr:NYN domain-containing protein [Deltaproteobacteria bacterium]
MRILIDGYNIIRRIPELSALDRADMEEGRDYLIGELSRYRSGKGHGIVVVFDGAGSYHLGDRGSRVKGITVIYSRQGRSADDVIAALCREGKADLLVTADRELCQRAERAGVPSATPELFWKKLEEEKFRKMKGLETEDEDYPSHGQGRRLRKKVRKVKNLLSRL